MNRTAKKIITVEEEETGMLVEGAREITTHLTAILNHEEAPETLRNAIADAIQNLFNDCEPEAQSAISDDPRYIQHILLGYGDNVEAIGAD